MHHSLHFFRFTPTLASFSSSYLLSLALALQLWYNSIFDLTILYVTYNLVCTCYLGMSVNQNQLTLLLLKVLRSDLGTSLDESMKGAMAR